MHRDLRPFFYFPRRPRDTDYGLYRYILFKQTLTSRPRYFVFGEGMSNILPAILVQCCCHSTLHRPEIIFIPTLSAALIFILRQRLLDFYQRTKDQKMRAERKKQRTDEMFYEIHCGSSKISRIILRIPEEFINF